MADNYGELYTCWHKNIDQNRFHAHDIENDSLIMPKCPGYLNTDEKGWFPIGVRWSFSSKPKISTIWGFMLMLLLCHSMIWHKPINQMAYADWPNGISQPVLRCFGSWSGLPWILFTTIRGVILQQKPIKVVWIRVIPDSIGLNG